MPKRNMTVDEMRRMFRLFFQTAEMVRACQTNFWQSPKGSEARIKWYKESRIQEQRLDSLINEIKNWGDKPEQQELQFNETS